MPWFKNNQSLNTSKQKQPATSCEIGSHSEAFAAKYLAGQGLDLILMNFHSRYGEIDLIMTDQACLTFVEVKYRQHDEFGGAIAAISATKQKKIKQCASFYLQQVRLNEYNTQCRFDVVALQGSLANPQITWLKNAF